MKPVHQKVEEVRVSKGVTKTHIAKKCGKTTSWYHGISTGRRTLNVDSLQQIATALDVDIRIFFENELSDTLNYKQQYEKGNQYEVCTACS
ncbi:XRE family transcriptional regulator [Paenibacillus albiflavus]|uniref:XRE family transcriptional regulator n=1 Tax=Paenibacillus albiflavus TaxID=2545760 RepID=A0A4R4EB43_9BACL|nr:helix-turn-helix transcriptional regulator [Paenibacillus albiflavus]TCZ76150.1 XRE family transcriptional regulator [Paenibacillus albiflavus]